MSITKEQWENVCVNFLGLRSEDNTTRVKGAASYSMDCGLKYTFGQEPPENWDTLLRGTIEYIKGFPNHESRFLLIVSKSHGASSEYMGCFPKCSSKAPTIHASEPLNNTVDHLVEWVMTHI